MSPRRRSYSRSRRPTRRYREYSPSDDYDEEYPVHRRHHSDRDALAYGYYPSKRPYPPRDFEQPMNPAPRYEMRYAQQPYYGRPPPAPIYHNRYASESSLAPVPPQPQPYYPPDAWTSHSSFDLPSQHDQRGQDAGWQGDEPAPALPPRPVSRTRGREDCPIARGMNQGAALYENMRGRLGDIWGEPEDNDADRHDDLDLEELEDLTRDMSLEEEGGTRAATETQRSARPRPDGHSKQRSKSTLLNYKKTWVYANSRLPPYQPPFKVYLETWRVIYTAARASSQVYERPRSGQREQFIDADWRNGTKAMVLKSTPVDDSNLIVFAIRGSGKNFVDWAVNFRPAPTPPIGFLDDGGNACHAGFLSVARAMIAPVAARLRQLLEQDPSRCNSSLVITGHSAGGAVASLLYSHMLATSVQSELNILTGFFKRVHCITFGAPPVSFLPLQKPPSPDKGKSLFLSFANEGDLVVRADKAYLVSLMKLIAAPGSSTAPSSVHTLAKKVSLATTKTSKPNREPAPYWPVPPATLSNAGRLVVLREKPGTQRHPVVEAISTTDEQLRDFVFGDPAMHVMTLYRQRIEKLALTAIMGDDPV